MNLTLDDKRTIFQILNLIMKADLVVKQEEVKFLDSVFNEFGLSLDEFDHMDDIDTDYLKKQFAHLLISKSNMQKSYSCRWQDAMGLWTQEKWTQLIISNETLMTI